MAASLNKVLLIGNLTRDPDIRTTPAGDKVAELRLAVSETYRNRQTNELKEITAFVDVSVWGRMAETCQQYLSKGKPILVEGRLAYDEWKNDKGETRSRLRVRADRIQFLNPAPRREDGSTPGGYPQQAPSAAPQQTSYQQPTSAPPPPVDDIASDLDDLPF